MHTLFEAGFLAAQALHKREATLIFQTYSPNDLTAFRLHVVQNFGPITHTLNLSKLANGMPLELWIVPSPDKIKDNAKALTILSLLREMQLRIYNPKTEGYAKHIANWLFQERQVRASVPKSLGKGTCLCITVGLGPISRTLCKPDTSLKLSTLMDKNITVHGELEKEVFPDGEDAISYNFSQQELSNLLKQSGVIEDNLILDDLPFDPTAILQDSAFQDSSLSKALGDPPSNTLGDNPSNASSDTQNGSPQSYHKGTGKSQGESSNDAPEAQDEAYIVSQADTDNDAQARAQGESHTKVKAGSQVGTLAGTQAGSQTDAQDQDPIRRLSKARFAKKLAQLTAETDVLTQSQRYAATSDQGSYEQLVDTVAASINDEEDEQNSTLVALDLLCGDPKIAKASLKYIKEMVEGEMAKIKVNGAGLDALEQTFSYPKNYINNPWDKRIKGIISLGVKRYRLNEKANQDDAVPAAGSVDSDLSHQHSDETTTIATSKTQSATKSESQLTTHPEINSEGMVKIQTEGEIEGAIETKSKSQAQVEAKVENVAVTEAGTEDEAKPQAQTEHVSKTKSNGKDKGNGKGKVTTNLEAQAVSKADSTETQTKSQEAQSKVQSKIQAQPKTWVQAQTKAQAQSKSQTKPSTSNTGTKSKYSKNHPDFKEFMEPQDRFKQNSNLDDDSFDDDRELDEYWAEQDREADELDIWGNLFGILDDEEVEKSTPSKSKRQQYQQFTYLSDSAQDQDAKNYIRTDEPIFQDKIVIVQDPELQSELQPLQPLQSGLQPDSQSLQSGLQSGLQPNLQKVAEDAPTANQGHPEDSIAKIDPKSDTNTALQACLDYAEYLDQKYTLPATQTAQPNQAQAQNSAQAKGTQAKNLAVDVSENKASVVVAEVVSEAVAKTKSEAKSKAKTEAKAEAESKAEVTTSVNAATSMTDKSAGTAGAKAGTITKTGSKAADSAQAASGDELLTIKHGDTAHTPYPYHLENFPEIPIDPKWEYATLDCQAIHQNKLYPAGLELLELKIRLLNSGEQFIREQLEPAIEQFLTYLHTIRQCLFTNLWERERLHPDEPKHYEEVKVIHNANLMDAVDFSDVPNARPMPTLALSKAGMDLQPDDSQSKPQSLSDIELNSVSLNNNELIFIRDYCHYIETEISPHILKLQEGARNLRFQRNITLEIKYHNDELLKAQTASHPAGAPLEPAQSDQPVLPAQSAQSKTNSLNEHVTERWTIDVEPMLLRMARESNYVPEIPNLKLVVDCLKFIKLTASEIPQDAKSYPELSAVIQPFAHMFKQPLWQLKLLSTLLPEDDNAVCPDPVLTSDATIQEYKAYTQGFKQGKAPGSHKNGQPYLHFDMPKHSTLVLPPLSNDPGEINLDYDDEFEDFEPHDDEPFETDEFEQALLEQPELALNQAQELSQVQPQGQTLSQGPGMLQGMAQPQGRTQPQGQAMLQGMAQPQGRTQPQGQAQPQVKDQSAQAASQNTNLELNANLSLAFTHTYAIQSKLTDEAHDQRANKAYNDWALVYHDTYDEIVYLNPGVTAKVLDPLSLSATEPSPTSVDIAIAFATTLASTAQSQADLQEDKAKSTETRKLREQGERTEIKESAQPEEIQVQLSCEEAQQAAHTAAQQAAALLPIPTEAWDKHESLEEFALNLENADQLEATKDALTYAKFDEGGVKHYYEFIMWTVLPPELDKFEQSWQSQMLEHCIFAVTHGHKSVEMGQRFGFPQPIHGYAGAALFLNQNAPEAKTKDLITLDNKRVVSFTYFMGLLADEFEFLQRYGILDLSYHLFDHPTILLPQRSSYLFHSPEPKEQSPIILDDARMNAINWYNDMAHSVMENSALNLPDHTDNPGPGTNNHGAGNMAHSGDTGDTNMANENMANAHPILPQTNLDALAPYTRLACVLYWALRRGFTSIAFNEHYPELLQNFMHENFDLRLFIKKRLNGQLQRWFFSIEVQFFMQLYYDPTNIPNIHGDLDSYALSRLGPEEFVNYKNPLWHVPYDQQFARDIFHIFNVRYQFLTELNSLKPFEFPKLTVPQATSQLLNSWANQYTSYLNLDNKMALRLMFEYDYAACQDLQDHTFSVILELKSNWPRQPLLTAPELGETKQSRFENEFELYQLFGISHMPTYNELFNCSLNKVQILNVQNQLLNLDRQRTNGNFKLLGAWNLALQTWVDSNLERLALNEFGISNEQAACELQIILDCLDAYYQNPPLNNTLATYWNYRPLNSAMMEALVKQAYTELVDHIDNFLREKPTMSLERFRECAATLFPKIKRCTELHHKLQDCLAMAKVQADPACSPRPLYQSKTMAQSQSHTQTQPQAQAQAQPQNQAQVQFAAKENKNSKGKVNDKAKAKNKYAKSKNKEGAPTLKKLVQGLDLNSVNLPEQIALIREQVEKEFAKLSEQMIKQDANLLMRTNIIRAQYRNQTLSNLLEDGPELFSLKMDYPLGDSRELIELFKTMLQEIQKLKTYVPEPDQTFEFAIWAYVMANQQISGNADELLQVGRNLARLAHKIYLKLQPLTKDTDKNKAQAQAPAQAQSQAQPAQNQAVQDQTASCQTPELQTPEALAPGTKTPVSQGQQSALEDKIEQLWPLIMTAPLYKAQLLNKAQSFYGFSPILAAPLSRFLHKFTSNTSRRLADRALSYKLKSRLWMQMAVAEIKRLGKMNNLQAEWLNLDTLEQVDNPFLQQRLIQFKACAKAHMVDNHAWCFTSYELDRLTIAPSELTATYYTLPSDISLTTTSYDELLDQISLKLGFEPVPNPVVQSYETAHTQPQAQPQIQSQAMSQAQPQAMAQDQSQVQAQNMDQAMSQAQALAQSQANPNTQAQATAGKAQKTVQSEAIAGTIAPDMGHESKTLSTENHQAAESDYAVVVEDKDKDKDESAELMLEEHGDIYLRMQHRAQRVAKKYDISNPEPGKLSSLEAFELSLNTMRAAVYFNHAYLPTLGNTQDFVKYCFAAPHHQDVAMPEFKPYNAHPITLNPTYLPLGQILQTLQHQHEMGRLYNLQDNGLNQRLNYNLTLGQQLELTVTSPLTLVTQAPAPTAQQVTAAQLAATSAKSQADSQIAQADDQISAQADDQITVQDDVQAGDQATIQAEGQAHLQAQAGREQPVAKAAKSQLAQPSATRNAISKTDTLLAMASFADEQSRLKQNSLKPSAGKTPAKNASEEGAQVELTAVAPTKMAQGSKGSQSTGTLNSQCTGTWGSQGNLGGQSNQTNESLHQALGGDKGTASEPWQRYLSEPSQFDLSVEFISYWFNQEFDRQFAATNQQNSKQRARENFARRASMANTYPLLFLYHYLHQIQWSDLSKVKQNLDQWFILPLEKAYSGKTPLEQTRETLSKLVQANQSCSEPDSGLAQGQDQLSAQEPEQQLEHKMRLDQLSKVKDSFIANVVQNGPKRQADIRLAAQNYREKHVATRQERYKEYLNVAQQNQERCAELDYKWRRDKYGTSPVVERLISQRQSEASLAGINWKDQIAGQGESHQYYESEFHPWTVNSLVGQDRYLVKFPFSNPWEIWCVITEGKWSRYVDSITWIELNREWFIRFGAKPREITENRVIYKLQKRPTLELANLVAEQMFSVCPGLLNLGHLSQLATYLTTTDTWILSW